MAAPPAEVVAWTVRRSEQEVSFTGTGRATPALGTGRIELEFSHAEFNNFVLIGLVGVVVASMWLFIPGRDSRSVWRQGLAAYTAAYSLLIVVTVMRLPDSPNHRHLMTVMAFAYAVALLLGLLRRRRSGRTGAATLQQRPWVGSAAQPGIRPENDRCDPSGMGAVSVSDEERAAFWTS